MRIIGIIPARYSSSRFPGKPLVLIKNKPLIQWVYEKAIRSVKLDAVFIATDDKRIFSAAKFFGASVIMTPKNCASGTGRVAIAASKLKGDVFINIQGDEPLISPKTINAVADVFLKNKKIDCATAIFKTSDLSVVNNQNTVKVVLDKYNNAMFFSRAVIPFCRDKDKKLYYNKHIGIYGYTRKFLATITKMSSTELENIEKLEQLKILWHGFKIKCVCAHSDSIGIDRLEDIRKVLTKI